MTTAAMNQNVAEPVTFLPFVRERVAMQPAQLCISGPHKIHCPYCAMCACVGPGDYQMCGACYGVYSLKSAPEPGRNGHEPEFNLNGGSKW